MEYIYYGALDLQIITYVTNTQYNWMCMHITVYAVMLRILYISDTEAFKLLPFKD